MARTIEDRQRMKTAQAELLARTRFPGAPGGAVVALKIGDEVKHNNLGRGLVTDTDVGSAVVLFRSGQRETVPNAELYLWRAT